MRGGSEVLPDAYTAAYMVVAALIPRQESTEEDGKEMREDDEAEGSPVEEG